MHGPNDLLSNGISQKLRRPAVHNFWKISNNNLPRCRNPGMVNMALRLRLLTLHSPRLVQCTTLFSAKQMLLRRGLQWLLDWQRQQHIIVVRRLLAGRLLRLRLLLAPRIILPLVGLPQGQDFLRGTINTRAMEFL
jgi:hypothetical protein